MDRNSTIGSPDGQEGQGRQSRSPERRNQPETSQERANRYMRNFGLVSRDSPSTSDTHHTTASELGQQRGQDHQQHDREQERQTNILHRMLGCMLDCLPALNADRQYMLGVSLYRHGLHEYGHGWHEPEPESSWQREERQRQERQRQEDQRQERENQEKRGQLLGINLSEVKEERWIKFGKDLLVKYGDLHTNEENQSDEEDQIEKKDLRLLGDIIIQYGTSEQVDNKEREGKAYAELKGWIRDKWEEWNKNNEQKSTCEDKLTQD